MDGTVGSPSPAGAVRPLARRAISTALIHWFSPRSTCDPDPAHEDVNLCEKPVGNSYITLAVCTSLAGTIAGTTIIMLLWLHFRRMARDRREYDPFELADYGIEEEDLSAEKRLMKKRASLGTKAFHIHRLATRVGALVRKATTTRHRSSRVALCRGQPWIYTRRPVAGAAHREKSDEFSTADDGRVATGEARAAIAKEEASPDIQSRAKN
ncbi:uncharacterized protein E0L32_002314 [Thyridium curvatum]|uniref:Uncharacterized protein n=1 Tax=Thyridium curvatum TaxID=1093900 RepID=A0A507APQ0_9PEZI|nr:uncharacterized protein E0L32_002314 [Thyridium curvatum]TPX06818.1 hypothetical protein E0L32_002314 [Thyridium curvatum]